MSKLFCVNAASAPPVPEGGAAVVLAVLVSGAVAVGLVVWEDVVEIAGDDVETVDVDC